MLGVTTARRQSLASTGSKEGNRPMRTAATALLAALLAAAPLLPADFCPISDEQRNSAVGLYKQSDHNPKVWHHVLTVHGYWAVDLEVCLEVRAFIEAQTDARYLCIEVEDASGELVMLGLAEAEDLLEDEHRARFAKRTEDGRPE